jgi:uncharacterized protein YcbX
MPTVSQLFVYPIKSCRGIAVEAAAVESRGLAGDRRYMLVDANGRFVTQRQHPRMALIGVSRDGDAWLVEAPGQEPLRLPVSMSASVMVAASTCQVRIWRQTVEATLADADTNIWFSSFLGFACGLVYMDDHQHRPVENDAAAFDDEVSFADGAPVMLLSDASLAELNGRLERPVTIDRFRPNIVVSAETPFEEDDWRNVAIGTARMDVAWPCARCALPTVDPETGERDPDGEPLRTLMSYRRRGTNTYFGQNLLPREPGVIAVGDVVSVQ